MNTTPNFSAMQELMKRLGNPQNSMKYVHVAGTNGKGSTCAMLAAVLQAAGYRTGLYTSPHLMKREERISVNGRRILPEEWQALAEEVDAAAAGMEEKPVDFTLITAVAFLYFAREACDIVVLEVGMGGRMDPTNVIRTPEAAVITGLGMDHTAILGNTLAEIAGEKAGIIKRGGDVVLYSQTEEAEEVIRAAVRRKRAHLTVTRPEELSVISRGMDGQCVSYRKWEGLFLKLIGSYQALNLCAVLDTLDILNKKGWQVSEEAIRQGLAEVVWPARFELMRRKPLVILDGAHNDHGIAALAECLADYLPGRKFIFVMGVMNDKNVEKMLLCLAPFACRFITVTPSNARALDCESFAEKIEALTGIPAEAAGEVAAGIRRALTLSESGAAGTDAVCICGSLYQAGEVRRYFGLD